jgi:hypothetical protein
LLLALMMMTRTRMMRTQYLGHPESGRLVGC